MGTRSAIGYQLPSGKIRAVYCHWDGYPEHQLPILNEHYSTISAVKSLIKPGSMSCLRSTDTWESTFQKDADGRTNYDLPKTHQRDPQPVYHCERGDGQKPVIRASSTAEKYWRNMDCEHLYVFHPEHNYWQHIELY